jgi:hypothetical protein
MTALIMRQTLLAWICLSVLSFLAATRSPDPKDRIVQQDMEESQYVADVCWDGPENFAAAYVAGKGFELLLGPFPLLEEGVDQGIPHLYETRKDKSYKQVGRIPKDACERTVKVLYQSIHKTERYHRYRQILACAQQQHATLASETRAAHLLLVFLSSELAHRATYATDMICNALQRENAKTWITHEQKNGRKGLESLTSNEEVVFASCSEADGAICNAAASVSWDSCEPERWRECESAKRDDAMDMRSGLVKSVLLSSKRGFDVVVAEMAMMAHEQVKSAYREVLGREADESGLAYYVDGEIARGKSEVDVIRALKESQEYKTRTVQAGDRANEGSDDAVLHTHTAARKSEKKEQDAQKKQKQDIENKQQHTNTDSEHISVEATLRAETVFRDCLLRAPEPGALRSYALLLHRNGGNEAEMREILVKSEEYKALCDKVRMGMYACVCVYVYFIAMEVTGWRCAGYWSSRRGIRHCARR